MSLIFVLLSNFDSIMQEKVLTILKELNIDYRLTEHDAVPTVEAAEKFWKDIEGMHCKNLFFRNNKGKKHYLLVAEKDTKISIKGFAEKIGSDRLSFASEKRMDKYLQIKPGSVTPFGVINDTENHVRVYFDAKIKEAKIVNFHPNINTATVSLSLEDFLKFMDWSQNEYSFVDLGG